MEKRINGILFSWFIGMSIMAYIESFIVFYTCKSLFLNTKTQNFDALFLFIIIWLVVTTALIFYSLRYIQRFLYKKEDQIHRRLTGVLPEPYIPDRHLHLERIQFYCSVITKGMTTINLFLGYLGIRVNDMFDNSTISVRFLFIIFILLSIYPLNIALSIYKEDLK